LCGWEVDRSGSGSCPMVGLSIGSIEPSGSAITELICYCTEYTSLNRRKVMEVGIFLEVLRKK